eukprot:TRINITY_DN6383_c1_g1_i2.p1 TRINITY_DN6383_c1_g1~~TRINITY_DN6383_c1_g1_i2.p1  ORF type:complete len:349 (+),score=39.93 TRINITY_DN6383_c1_g1_i2:117-1163(+)
MKDMKFVLIVFSIVFFALALPSECCNKKSAEAKKPKEEKRPETLDTLEEEEDDDSIEAFPDIEEQDILCHGYTPKPTTQELPKAVIFGTRKGGTRALLEFLNMHSLVRRSKPEIHFYDKHYKKGIEWYKAKMPFLTEGQIGMEKTPGYFHTPEVPKRMFETKNDTKLLLIIRDPVKRMISDYNQFVYNNMAQGNSYPNIETFLLKEDGSINEDYPPLKRSLYHQHMANWLEYFPLDQIYIVDGDRFIKEPWKEMEKVESFLELPHQVGINNFYFNQTKGFYCGKEIIENVNSQWTCTRNKCLSKSKGRKPPSVDAGLLQRLYDYMDVHNQKFFKLVNRSDIVWQRPEF